MSSDKNQVEAIRCTRLVQSIYDLERSGARDWPWIAAQLQRIVDMSNHLKHRQPLFFELKQLLETEYITMGKGVAANIKLMASSPCILGMTLDSKEQSSGLFNLFSTPSDMIEYVTPGMLAKIKIKEIEMPLHNFSLIPEAPGSYDKTINDMCASLAKSLAQELTLNYVLGAEWLEYFYVYFTKMLCYTVVSGIYNVGSNVPRYLYGLINEPTYREHAGGINIPLGYYPNPRRLLVLCESNQIKS